MLEGAATLFRGQDWSTFASPKPRRCLMWIILIVEPSKLKRVDRTCSQVRCDLQPVSGVLAVNWFHGSRDVRHVRASSINPLTTPTHTRVKASCRAFMFIPLTKMY